MKAVLMVALLAVALSGCTTNRGRTTQMNPDCTQVSAEQVQQGKCMYRPELPDQAKP